jgi:hypothetical protein
VEASANLEGSRVLAHQGHGHRLTNHPSKGTIKAVYDDFNERKPLEVGKVWEPDQKAWEVALEALEELIGDGSSK